MEDTDIHRELIRNLLEDDYEVHAAASIDHAVAELESFKPDCVVLDIWVGDDVMAGLELARRIKQGDRPNTPILFITAHHVAEVRKQITEDEELSSIEVLEKPFDITELKAKIRAL